MAEAEVNLYLRYENKQFAAKKRQLPITLLCGALGAGKTTLLKHILHNRRNLSIAAAVNDFAALNVDGESVRRERICEGLLELSNGCFVCNLDAEFEPAIWKLLNDDYAVDYLLIECSGVTDPLAAIRTLERKYGRMTRARLDCVVCVVDVDALFGSLSGSSSDWRLHEEELFLNQIRSSDVVLMNKVDLLSPSDLERVERYLRVSFPTVRVHATCFSKIDLSCILDIEDVGAGSLSSVLSHETAITFAVTSKGGHRSTTAATAAESRPLRHVTSYDGDYLKRLDMHSISFTSSTPLRLRECQDVFCRDLFELSSEADGSGQVVRAKGTLWFAEDRTCRSTFHLSGRRRYSLVTENKWDIPPAVSIILMSRGVQPDTVTARLRRACGDAGTSPTSATAADDGSNSSVNSADLMTLQIALDEARELIQQHGDGCFQVAQSLREEEQYCVLFRLTGSGYYHMDLQHLRSHAIVPNEITLSLLQSLNMHGIFMTHAVRDPREVQVSESYNACTHDADSHSHSHGHITGHGCSLAASAAAYHEVDASVWLRWAVGGQVQLSSLWPQIMSDAKKILDENMRKAHRCACGR